RIRRRRCQHRENVTSTEHASIIGHSPPERRSVPGSSATTHARAVYPNANQAHENDSGDDRVADCAKAHDPDRHGAGHRAREKRNPNHERSGNENQYGACDLYDSGEVAEPLPEPDLLEQPDPHRVRLELAPSNRAEHDRDRNAQNPCDQQILACRSVVWNELQVGHSKLSERGRSTWSDMLHGSRRVRQRELFRRRCVMGVVRLPLDLHRKRSREAGSESMFARDAAVLQGTLELLVLKRLSWGPMHGYGIARWIETAT